MKIEIVVMTPALAAEMLQRNVGNRPLRRGTVDALKAAFMRGEYVMSHQGIALFNGNVLDGQHRLVAISEMPATFTCQILVTHLDNADAYTVMDIGFKRTASDILGEDRRLVECARFLATLYLGRSNTITPTYLAPFIEHAREPHVALMAFCSTVGKVWSSAPIRAAYCVISFSGGDVDHAKLVYRALVLQDFAAMPRCAHAVVRANINRRLSGSNYFDTFARARRVLDPKNANKSKVQINDVKAEIEDARQIIHREIFGDTKINRRLVRTGAEKTLLATAP